MSIGVNLKTDFYVAQPDATYVSNIFKLKEPPKMQQKTEEIKAKRFFEQKQKELEEEAYRIKKETVSDIITNHPRKKPEVNVENMAEMIMNASQETGIDPIIIAHIAGQESGYTQSCGKNGQGIMQLVSISIKDMFQRPNYYGGNLKSILNEYKTPQKLMEAAKKDPQLNLTLGAYCFKAKLKLAKGNLLKAFEYYNGSPLKYSYSKQLESSVENSRKSIRFSNMA